MARPEGFEPPTLCLEGRRSIRLSYGRFDTILHRLAPDRPLFWAACLRLPAPPIGAGVMKFGLSLSDLLAPRAPGQ